MRTGLLLTGIFSLLLSVSACKDDKGTPDSVIQNRDINITSKVISTNFVGNGAQWGGYDNVSTWFDGQTTLSDADWAKLFNRIDYMRPPFLRILTGAGWAYDNDGEYDEITKTESLFKMLEYSQSRNIEITYGEWGHEYVGDKEIIDTDWIASSVKFLNHLVNEKGFACIKTVNIINEPNGYWSSTEGDYDIWKNVQVLYLEEMKKYELSSIKLMGPDVAIFDSSSEATWITKAAKDLGDDIGLYDIHVYPKQLIVRNGDYTKMLQAYRDATPEGKRIVLGEIGFKYTEVDADLKQKNEEAIAADPFAGEDSNMMIYEAFYGIDMADGIIQSMRAGFSGALVWSMDDAMYNSPSGDNPDWNTKELKRWGFWNILGEELTNDAADEDIRPYFYTASLLCRYFPAGCEIYDIELPNKKGVRAIMGMKDGKYTIALVNSHYVTYPINLKSDFLSTVTVDKYSYKSNADGSFVGKLNADGFATPLETGITLDLKTGVDMTLEGESFILFTNMD